MAHKKSKSERVGTIPYGFDLAADGVTLVRNEAEQAVIEIIQELRARGYSLRKIAVEAESRQFRTKNGETKWSHTTIKSILDRLAA